MGESYFRGHVTQRGIVFGPRGDVLLVTSGLRPWTFPGGRIEAEADPEAALRRTLYERVGLHTTVEEPVKTVTDIWGSGDEPVYAVLYRVQARSRDVDLGEEHDDFCWYTPDGAVEEMHFKSLETAVERAVANHQAAEWTAETEGPDGE
ncbi:NUDIX hydrolase [Halosimplex rubrum]|uniref:NUDIX hydrolase n=1 Tax=Halosimplex rubrum TaxID=869889 RepID=A0A7D5P8A7_9EURY|nr:NUDIX hydrolase [Halosimplex rubrum]QLH79778.1 NUDIX hydrolase [Halosimplex rubrum]